MNELKDRNSNLDLLLSLVIVLAVFVNVLRLESNFSMDSQAYLDIFQFIKDTSFEELKNRIYFPYIFFDSIQTYEVGFVLFVKALSFLGLSAKGLYGLIVGLSIGCRVFILRKIGCPWYGIALINLYAVTLLDANALRLGIGVSVIMLAMYLIGLNKLTGWVFLFLSALIHLQTIFLILPFTLGWIVKKQLTKNSFTRVTFAILAMISGYSIIKVLPSIYIENAKLTSYTLMEIGAEASGLSLTSFLGLCTLIGTLLWQNREIQSVSRLHIINSLVISGFFTISILLFSTDMAIFGDRIWQPTVVLLSAFLYPMFKKGRKIPIPVFIVTTLLLVCNVNVILRYPQSNFFSPLVPHAELLLNLK